MIRVLKLALKGPLRCCVRPVVRAGSGNVNASDCLGAVDRKSAVAVALLEPLLGGKVAPRTIACRTITLRNYWLSIRCRNRWGPLFRENSCLPLFRS